MSGEGLMVAALTTGIRCFCQLPSTGAVVQLDSTRSRELLFDTLANQRSSCLRQFVCLVFSTKAFSLVAFRRAFYDVFVHIGLSEQDVPLNLRTKGMMVYRVIVGLLTPVNETFR